MRFVVLLLALVITACVMLYEERVVKVFPEDFARTEIDIDHIPTKLIVKSQVGNSISLFSFSSPSHTAKSITVQCIDGKTEKNQCKPIDTLTLHKSLELVPSVAILGAAKASLLYTAGRSRINPSELMIARLDARTFEIEYARFRHPLKPTQAFLDHDERYMYLAEPNRSYVIRSDLHNAFDAKNKFSTAFTEIPMSGKIVYLGLYPDGKLLAAVTLTGVINIIETSTGRLLSSFEHFPKPPVAAAIGVKPASDPKHKSIGYMYTTDENNKYMTSYELDSNRLRPRVASFPYVNSASLFSTDPKEEKEKDYPFISSTKITISGNGSWIYIWNKLSKKINVYLLRGDFTLKWVSIIELDEQIIDLATNYFGDVITVAPMNKKKIVIYLRRF